MYMRCLVQKALEYGSYGDGPSRAPPFRIWWLGIKQKEPDSTGFLHFKKFPPSLLWGTPHPTPHPHTYSRFSLPSNFNMLLPLKRLSRSCTQMPNNDFSAGKVASSGEVQFTVYFIALATEPTEHRPLPLLLWIECFNQRTF